MHNDTVFRNLPPQYTWCHHSVLTAVVAFHPNCNLQYRELWWEWGEAVTTLQPYYLQNTKRIPGDCLEVDMENSESEYVQDGYSSVDITVVVLGRNHKLFHGVFWAHYCVWSRTSIRGGVHTCCVNCVDFRLGQGSYMLLRLSSMQHAWAPPLMEVRHYSASNAITQSNYAKYSISTQHCHM